MGKDYSAASSFRGFLPWWMWLIVTVQCALVSFFAIATVMDPASLLPNNQALDYLTLLYVTRNLTMVLGVLLALLFRSYSGLLIMLLVRVLTDMGDVLNVYYFDVTEIKASVPMVIALLIVPAWIAILHLWKRLR